MPLLHKGQLIENDKWTVVTDDADLPDKLEHAIISLQRFIESQANDRKPVPDEVFMPGGVLMPGGVHVAPADDVSLLAPFVSQLKLIAINFPVYTDGRGYSHARLLRKRLAYNGELRAIGDIRADQVLFMARSGIDSFDFSHQPDKQLIDSMTTRYQKNYQPSYPLPIVG